MNDRDWRQSLFVFWEDGYDFFGRRNQRLDCFHSNRCRTGVFHPLFHCRTVSGGRTVNAPTLQSAERLVVNKFIYRFRPPERGEILVFRYPRDPSRDFIKRVIAVPGDTIEIRDGRVYVNAALLNEPYILSKTRGNYPLATVPDGHIFVMGDNRNNSEDSRFADVGFVPFDLIKGKAMLVFWPVSQFKTLP